MNTDPRSIDADESLRRLTNELSASEFGFRVQAFAAHVLLRLGFDIIEINTSGHPDILATRLGKPFLFEVEAEVTWRRARQLDTADFASLLGSPGASAWYALARRSPTAQWLLVPANRLGTRTRPTPTSILQSLSDKSYSQEWTICYRELLQDSAHVIRVYPYEKLREMALKGNGL